MHACSSPSHPAPCPASSQCRTDRSSPRRTSSLPLSRVSPSTASSSKSSSSPSPSSHPIPVYRRVHRIHRSSTPSLQPSIQSSSTRGNPLTCGSASWRRCPPGSRSWPCGEGCACSASGRCPACACASPWPGARLLVVCFVFWLVSGPQREKERLRVRGQLGTAREQPLLLVSCHVTPTQPFLSLQDALESTGAHASPPPGTGAPPPPPPTGVCRPFIPNHRVPRANPTDITPPMQRNPTARFYPNHRRHHSSRRHRRWRCHQPHHHHTTTHIASSWWSRRSRTTRRHPSGCGRTGGRSDGRPCETCCASHRKKWYPWSSCWSSLLELRKGLLCCKEIVQRRRARAAAAAVARGLESEVKEGVGGGGRGEGIWAKAVGVATHGRLREDASFAGAG